MILRTNSKIWFLSMLIPFLIVGPSAGGAAQISDPNSIIKNKWLFILLQIQKFDW